MASAHVKKVQRKSGTRWIVRYRPGGRSSPTRHAGTFKTAKLAGDRLDVVLSALARGEEPVFEIEQSQVLSVSSAFDRYKASRLDWAPVTVRVFDQAKKRLGVLGRKDVRHVTVEDVQAWVAKQLAELAVSSVRKYLVQLRVVLDDVGVEPNPARSPRVKLPKERKAEVHPPSGAEMAAMLDALRASPGRRQPAALRHYPLVIEVLAATGLRVGEIVDLRWEDVDVTGGRLRVARDRTKGSTSGRRFVPLPGRLVASLVEIRPEGVLPDVPVFPRLSAQALRNVMSRACVRAGIPVFTPHDLRHRYISLLVMAGVPVTRVSDLAGHSASSLTVDVYSHVMMDEEASVLEEMRMLAGVS